MQNPVQLPHPSNAGFTLIELVMLITILSIVSSGIFSLFGQLVQGLESTKSVQASSQLLQECGEYLLGLRRKAGYGMNSINDCSRLATLNGEGPPVVTMTSPYAGTACPSLATCKHFQIKSVYASAESQAELVMVSY